MTVLKNIGEYINWVLSEYACDIFLPEEITALIDEEKPNEFPCLIYKVPDKTQGNVSKTIFISLREIEEWCHMLRIPLV